MPNFRVDTDGNLWIGTDISTDFATAKTEAKTKFYVEKDGTIKATAGTIGGIVIDADGIESDNYDVATKTGWRLDNSTGIAQYFDIDIVIPPSPNQIPTATERLNIGDGTIWYYAGELILSAPQVAIQDSSGTPGASSPSLAFTDGTYAEPGFYAVEDNAGQRAEFYMTSGSHDIFHTRSGFNVLYLDATYLSVYDGIGNNGEVLTRTSNGLEWTTTSGAHADTDHTSFANSSHNHTESDITNIGAHGHSYDNYSYWRLREDGNNVGTVSSTQSVNFIGGTNVTVSNSGSGGDYNITISASGGSGVTSVSGSTSAAADGQFFRTLAVAGTTLYFYESTRGDDLTIQGQRPTTNNSSSVGLSATQYNEVHARYGYFDFITGANVSSQDVKTDITDLDLGLDFINALAPKKYKYKPELKEDDGKFGFGFIAEEIETLLLNQGESNSKLHQEGHTDYPNYGRCAHELVCTCEDPECCPDPVRAFDEITQEWTYTDGCTKNAKCIMPCCTDIAGTTIDGINYVHATEEECETEFIDGRKYASVMKEELIAPLVKAVQELSTQISELTARVELLEG